MGSERKVFIVRTEKKVGKEEEDGYQSYLMLGGTIAVHPNSLRSHHK